MCSLTLKTLFISKEIGKWRVQFYQELLLTHSAGGLTDVYGDFGVMLVQNFLRIRPGSNGRHKPGKQPNSACSSAIKLFICCQQTSIHVREGGISLIRFFRFENQVLDFAYAIPFSSAKVSSRLCDYSRSLAPSGLQKKG